MIKIKEDDALWVLYKKYYEISGEKYRTPTSLCSYFWTAVAGLIAYWAAGIRLWLTVLIGSIMGGIGFFMFKGGISFDTFIGIFPLFLGIVFMSLGWGITFFIIGARLKGTIQKVYNNAWVAVAVSIFIYAGYDTYNNWEPSDVKMSQVFGGIALMFGGIALTYAIVAAIAFVLIRIYKPFSVTRFFAQLCAFCLALKNRACPLMEVDPLFEPVVEENIADEELDKPLEEEN